MDFAQLLLKAVCILRKKKFKKIVNRIAGKIKLKLIVVAQDTHLSKKIKQKIRCGDNGIFKGVPLTAEEKETTQKEIARRYL